MIEEQLAHRLRAAVADEPPMGFNPDDVVDLAARTDHRRSAMIAAATAAATVVVATVTVLQLVRAGDGGQAGVPAAVPTTKPADPCPPPSTKTEPSKPDTKPTEPSKTLPPKTEPSKTVPPKTTVTKPVETKPAQPPSCDKAVDKEFFTGWQDVAERLGAVAPQVLAERVPNMAFGDGTWKPHPGRRCLSGFYTGTSAGSADAVTLTVCHDQKTGPDLAVTDPGVDLGQPASDTTDRDGSRLRIYRTGNGVAVVHHRVDGVVVQVDTFAKVQCGPDPDGAACPVVTEQQLIAVATDGRLTF